MELNDGQSDFGVWLQQERRSRRSDGLQPLLLCLSPLSVTLTFPLSASLSLFPL